jgi:nickel-dependent lactate racemase
MEIELPFGRETYRLRHDGEVAVVEASGPDGPLPEVRALLDAALDAPIASPRLETLARAGDRVTVVVSDLTRDEPRGELLAAVRARLPSVRLTVAVATGTHGPCPREALGLPSDVAVVMHDGHRADDLVALGVTSRGTPVRIHRCAVEADLVVATGAIRPHYFAGFGAGAKAIYPGLGDAVGIRINHLLKREPASRAGVIVGNPCREDVEEAVRMLPGRTFLLDLVHDPRDQARDAVAGDVVEAFRAGAERARPWFEVHASPAPFVIAADRGPVTASLYQASKLLVAVAPLVEEGGTVVLLVDCADGIGPVQIVNEAIYELGIRPRLPARHRVVLVSSLARETVAPSYAAWAARIEDVVDPSARIVVAPRASKMIVA